MYGLDQFFYGCTPNDAKTFLDRSIYVQFMEPNYVSDTSEVKARVKVGERIFTFGRKNGVRHIELTPIDTPFLTDIDYEEAAYTLHQLAHMTAPIGLNDLVSYGWGVGYVARMTGEGYAITSYTSPLLQSVTTTIPANEIEFRLPPCLIKNMWVRPILIE